MQASGDFGFDAGLHRLLVERVELAHIFGRCNLSRTPLQGFALPKHLFTGLRKLLRLPRVVALHFPHKLRGLRRNRFDLRELVGPRRPLRLGRCRFDLVDRFGCFDGRFGCIGYGDRFDGRFGCACLFHCLPWLLLFGEV